MKIKILLYLISCICLSANTLHWTSADLGPSWGDCLELTTEVGSIGNTVWTDIEVSNLVGGVGTLSFPSWSISYAQKYYLVNQGDSIDANLVNDGTPIVDNTGSSIYDMPIIPNQTFMLGYWVDMNLFEPGVGPTIDDYYCWAELQWTGSNLVLLNSAGVSGAGGIYAGTWDVIPEPTTVVLFLLGGLAVFIKKKIVFFKD